MLVKQGDDLGRALGRHIGGGSIEPDDHGKLSIIGQKFFDLRDGLAMKIVVEVPVLRLVPVMGGGVVICP